MLQFWIPNQQPTVPKDSLRLILIALCIMWEALDNAAVFIDSQFLYGITFYFVFLVLG